MEVSTPGWPGTKPGGLEEQSGLTHAQGEMTGQQQRPDQGQQAIEGTDQARSGKPESRQQKQARRQCQGQAGGGQARQPGPLHEAQGGQGAPPEQALPMMETHIPSQHQQQPRFSRGQGHLALDIRRRRP